MKNLNRTNEQLRRSIAQKVKGSDREIAKSYVVMLNEIRKELTKLYEKYEVDGRLTYAEMAKYDRLTRLIEYINDLLKVGYKGLKQVIYDVLGESYLDGYYLTAWALETDTLSRLSYSAVPTSALKRMIENPVSGLTLSQRLEKNRTEIVYRIQQEVTQGLFKGETYGTMAKRLKTALNNDVNKAMRIVRTEAHRSSEAGKLDSAIHAHKNGVITMKEWNSVEDGSVRSAHRDLNGKKIPIDKDFTSKNGGRGKAPGQLASAKDDINCRCFLTYSVEKIEKPDFKELENMTFETWKKERLNG